ncbi:2-phosphosulfolactate phosphatase [Antrihabitans cavernicola]|uniref:Probable 2-phosphosulfolactate phosphatase n=1 Tax=Antrihabitans cavernicola TaxID=2495913 RepID=A0A5A7S456_9NOCA|nr:2-phosphosulfolactate phosphatase [Spelaeibacter cavernicola]KAA0020179.1 2-phosphosulfolactate phosphatase [Spelaeibacter cavernicola]
MLPAHTQGDHRIRFDWGLSGARAIVGGCDIAVVVDVLSFTTTLTVALDRGIEVLPYPWADGAAEFARDHGADLAVGRRQRQPGQVSLSPATVRDAVDIQRLVLPSPNGSSISFALADAGVTVIGASLRNAGAVAQYLAASDAVVAVIAAGERWPDGTLRPAVEDLWGAGAVLAKLDGLSLSQEARVARSAFLALDDISAQLHCCASGRELIEGGFPEDVEIAAELDVSSVVPELRKGVFTAPSP